MIYETFVMLQIPMPFPGSAQAQNKFVIILWSAGDHHIF
jgi:hypothetical protein